MKKCFNKNTRRWWSWILTIAMIVGMVIPSSVTTRVRAAENGTNDATTATTKTYTYKFSANDLPIGNITAQTTIDVTAEEEASNKMSFVINPTASSSSSAIKVEEKSKTIGQESFTKWINLQGTGNSSSRSVSFTIPDNAVTATIKVYAVSGKTAVSRNMNISVGDTVKSQAFTTEAMWEEKVKDAGACMCSVYGTDSLRLYGITVEVEVAGHEHTYSTTPDSSSVAATCTSAGTEVYKCTVDGCTETKTETINALGHDYSLYVIDKEATTTEEGQASYHCSRCNEMKEDSQVKLPVISISEDGHTHSFDYEKGKVTKTATCTEKGVITYYCTVEGCTHTQTAEIPLAEHKYEEEVIKAATCTENGTKKFTCSVCDDEKTDVIKATGHDYGETVNAATCTEAGSITYVCKNNNCNDTYTVVTDKALGHDYTGETETTEATCTEDGVKSTHCTRCDSVQEETIKKLNHSWATRVTKEPTVSEDGEGETYCKRCNATGEKVTVEKLGESKEFVLTGSENVTISEATNMGTNDYFTVNATSANTVAVDESSKDGFTHRIKLGGTGAYPKADSTENYKNISFTVSDSALSATVVVYAMSSSSSGKGRNLKVSSSTGDFGSYEVDTSSLKSFTYEIPASALANDRTFYVYSDNSGINVYGVYVTEHYTEVGNSGSSGGSIGGDTQETTTASTAESTTQETTTATEAESTAQQTTTASTAESTTQETTTATTVESTTQQTTTEAASTEAVKEPETTTTEASKEPETSVAKTYTFDAATDSKFKALDQSAAFTGTVGTDGIFNITGTAKRSKSSTYSVELGKKETGAVEFTIDGTYDLTVTVTSTSNSNTSDMALLDSNGNKVQAKGVTSVDVPLVGSTQVEVTFANLSAGTYKLVSPKSSGNDRGFRLYKAVLTASEDVQPSESETASSATDSTNSSESTSAAEAAKPTESTTAAETTKPESSTSATESTSTTESTSATVSGSTTAKAVVITESSGYLEEAYAEWNPVANATGYSVYVKSENGSYTKIDKELVRKYKSSDGSYYYRADALGLSAGNYVLKIVPIISGAEAAAQAAETPVLTVSAHDRTGFAWVNGTSSGAYNEDGTLKSNAVVLYITEQTKDTISLEVVTNNKGKTETATGLQNILNLYKKGYDSRPLDIRIIGQITDLKDMEGGDIMISGNGDSKRLSCGITVEGVGEDATVYGWGIRIKNASNVEIRNLGIMLVDSNEGDNIGLQQSNDHIWVHNCDFFYGEAGGDSDQAKGDGALDCKKSTYITFSYNHFYDNGKCNLLGLSEGTTSDLYITYHHNWYDHSDSRHPRVRYYSAHVYNNYYDGNAKYGIGACLGSSIFAEGNYFRNCKYPMLTSMQGHDVVSDWTTLSRDVTNLATFSKENGGTIKAYNNKIIGGSGFTSYQECNTEFDAYVVESADEKVPSTVTSYAGGNTYNNFDTSSIMYSYTADDPDTAKEKVEKYAGRINGGDFSWTFTEADDTSYAVNTELKAALRAYKTSFVCIAGTDGLVDTDTSTGNEGSSGGSFGGTTETTTDAASTTTGTTGTTTGTTAGTATETTTQAPVSKTYTFDAASESVITGAEKKGAVSGSVGTDGFFTLTGTVTRSNSDKFSAELGKQESGALEFTVAEGADVTFAVSSTGSSNSSDMVLVDASGNRITPKDAKDAVVVLKGSDSATVQYTNLAAGTYKLVSPSDGSNNTRGFRVYSAAVTQTTAATSTEATKPEATTGTTETTKPEATTGTTTETTKPEVTTGTTTETTKPEAATGTTTETTKPEAATGTTTETTKPEATAPETTPTEAAKPDTTVSDTAATDVVLDNTSVENAQVTVVESGSGAPEMKFAEEKANVLSKLLTAEEVIAVNSGAAKVSVSMKVEAVNADDVKTESEAIKEKVSSLAEAETIGMYFDITVEKNVGGKAVEVKETPNGALSISMELPKSLLNADSSKTRSYSVVRYHVDTQTGSVSVDILPCSFADGKITFESDKFSVYAVIYSDSAVSDKAVIDTGKQEVNNSADTASSDKTGSSVQTGDKVSLSTIMLLLGLLLFSVAIITALVKRRKKEN